MAPMTTLRVGGPARYFAVVRAEEDVAQAFALAKERDLDVFVLGGGSNVLVSDKGFDGLVIQIALKGITVSIEAAQAENTTTALVTCAAGEDWDQFVAYCVSNDLAGVECLSGIPGSVGGTPVQNVGAYGQEVSETIVSVRCFDREKAEFADLSNEGCGFDYRQSIFNTSERGRYVVLSVKFELKPGGKPKLAYKDLLSHFKSADPTLAETRNAVLSIRRSKSMVIDADDPNFRSAGSFFKNPIVPVSFVREIEEKLMIQNVPNFRVNDGRVKIPAAWLIENAGFSKGSIYGNAGISSRHTLAIINRGGATAAEIVALKDLVQEAVAERFGIVLHPEPVFVGFED